MTKVESKRPLRPHPPLPLRRGGKKPGESLVPPAKGGFRGVILTPPPFRHLPYSGEARQVSLSRWDLGG